MDKAQLQERRDKAEERFNLLNEQKVQKEQEITDVTTELVKLQGEVRVLDELIATPGGVENVATEPNKIDIKEKSNGKT